MNTNEYVTMTGDVCIVKTSAAGVVEKLDIKNLVVTVGKTFIASRMAGVASAVMSHMAVGTGAAAAVVGDTTLGAEAGRVALTSGTASTNTVVYTATFGAGVGTGSLTEAALLNAGSGGTMLCRTVFPVVNKAAGDSIAISWTVTVN